MRLDLARHLKIFASTLFIQTSWSFFSMQGMGFLHSILSGTTRERRDRTMKEQKGFFNTHPYLASYVIGAALRLYDDGGRTAEEIKRFLAVAQTGFASTGDLLFWRSLRPALLMLSTVLAFKTGVAGMIAFLIVYNIFHLYHRFSGIYVGYINSVNTIFLLKSRRFVLLQRLSDLLGAAAVGLLIGIAKPVLPSLLIIPLTLFFSTLVMRRIPAILTVLMLLAIIILLGII